MTVTPGPSAAAHDGLALADVLPLPVAATSGVVGVLDPHPDAATATAAKTPPAASPLRML
jgi:hypothetical protein